MLLLLAGCATGRQEPQTVVKGTAAPSVVGSVQADFIYGSDQKAVVRRLEEIHAVILEKSPALILAQYDTPKMKKHPQVKLHFDTRDRLVKIEDIWPQ